MRYDSMNDHKAEAAVTADSNVRIYKNLITAAVLAGAS